MKKEILSLLQTFSDYIAPAMKKSHEESYEKHRKFVKEYFNINLPKKYEIIKSPSKRQPL